MMQSRLVLYLQNNRYFLIPLLLCLILLMLLILLLRSLMRRKRNLKDQEETDPYLAMDGVDFEDYCAGLLKDNGFSEVELTPATADFGVDIFAEKDGITYAFQCKRYDHPVGTRAVQEIYAGRDFYHVMVGVVLTNQNFTSGACKMAEALNILLWGKEELETLEALNSEDD